jgi:hypothetical protein
VPGSAALNVKGHAFFDSVSCVSAGNCAVTGTYTDRFGHIQPFVVKQKNGVWGKAVEVRGLAALNRGNAAMDISCASTGKCAGGGAYADGKKANQVFVTQP